MALEVLTVARLLTDDHHPSRGGALAEHGLRTEVVEVAPGADLGCTLERLDVEPGWEEGLRGWVLVGHVSFLPVGAGPQHSARGSDADFGGLRVGLACAHASVGGRSSGSCS